jgi:hypothetical protein
MERGNYGEDWVGLPLSEGARKRGLFVGDAICFAIGNLQFIFINIANIHQVSSNIKTD